MTARGGSRPRGQESGAALLAAIEAYATAGEIPDALRRVFGEYKEAVVV